MEPENEIAEMPDAPEMDMQEAGPEAGPLLQEAVAEAAAFHARVTAGLAEIPVTPKRLAPSLSPLNQNCIVVPSASCCLL